MQELLLSLHESLKNIIVEAKRSKDNIIIDENDEIDVFATYLAFKKNDLIDKAAMPKDSIIYLYGEDIFTEAIKAGYIRKGQGVNQSKYFISSLGFYYLYQQLDKSLNTVLKTLDLQKFTEVELKLKSQEKIWCIFLILVNACDETNAFNKSKLNPEQLRKHFEFLKKIEDKMNNAHIRLGKSIGWGSGKDSSFSSFITNNVDLPKTGVYSFTRNGLYWLDFSKKRNVKLILDLILNTYEGINRVTANSVFYEILWDLSNDMMFELGLVPDQINEYIKSELGA